MDDTAPLSADRTPIVLPRMVGRYILLDLLGEGGSGRVFAAFDPDLDRKIAIKLLRSDRSPGVLVREGRMLARPSHPSIIAVHDIGESELGGVFLAMELAAQGDVGRWIERQQQPASWRPLFSALLEAARGLAAAHDQGVVHGDIKPSNLLVDGHGRIRISDFGIARLVNGDAENTTLTEGGESTQPAGTPAFMAPEQLDGAPADACSDQFSFCVTLYALLSGQHRPAMARAANGSPVGGDVGRKSTTHIRDDAYPWPVASPIPRRIRRAILRGLAPDPCERWPDMRALLAELSRDVWQARRRRALVLVPVLGLSTLSWVFGSEDATLCRGAPVHVAAVWSPARRAAVEQAFARASEAVGDGTWDAVAPRLDAYVERWQVAYTENCEATLRGEQSATRMDRQMACLQRAKRKFGTVVEVLADADADVAYHAFDVVAGLIPVEACAQVEGLDGTVLPPSDDIDDAVADLRSELDRVQTVRLAGRYANALEHMAPLDRRSASLAYAPVQAEVALERGAILHDLARYDEAREQLEQAVEGALRTGQTATAAHAAIRLLRVIGYELGRHTEGLHYAPIARALAGASEDPRLQAEVLLAQGAVLWRASDHAGAELAYRRASEMLEHDLGPTAPAVSTARSDWAVSLNLLGRHAEAERVHRGVLQTRIVLLGPHHPDVAQSRNNLGDLLTDMGHYTEAEAELRMALTAYARSELRSTHHDVAITHQNLARVLAMQGRYAEAEDEARRGLEAFSTALGPRHQETLVGRLTLAVIVEARGAPDEAIELLREVLRDAAATLGPDHDLVATAHDSLGGVLHGAGNIDEAEQHLRRALAIREQSLGPGHPDVANSRHNLGAWLRDVGRLAEAAQAFESALEALEAIDPASPAAATTLHALGAMAYHRGQYAVASQQLERAWTIRQAHAVPAHLRANTGFLLARAAWSAGGQQRHALEVAHAARQAFADAGEQYAPQVARVGAWIAERERDRSQDVIRP